MADCVSGEHLFCSTDAVNQQFMASKRLAEIICQTLSTQSNQIFQLWLVVLGLVQCHVQETEKGGPIFNPH